jgi:hypothetical protein
VRKNCLRISERRTEAAALGPIGSLALSAQRKTVE